MTVTGVYSAECPKLPDGRRQHFFRKMDGFYVCQNCGATSNPAQRWEPKSS